MGRTLPILAAGLAVAAMAFPLAADGAANARLGPSAILERGEAAVGRMVRPHVLTDGAGTPLSLAAYRGRPLVVSLVYTGCASVCPTATQRLIAAVVDARRALGDGSFAVLTVGFDARHDSPERMTAFARDQGIEAADWRVASADAGILTALLDDLGFTYAAAAGGFEHVVQTTILDADGRVYRQVYGDAFPTPVFVEPLKELVLGTGLRSISPGGLADRIKFLCTVYNPASGAYEFDYAIVFGISIGGFSLLLFGLAIIRLWRGNRRLLAAAGRNRPGIP